MIRFDAGATAQFLEEGELDNLWLRVEAAHQALVNKSGRGAEFTGWRDLLAEPNEALLDDIAATAAKIRENADVFLSIGIGGSYLGAVATIEALTPYFGYDGPEILYAGHQMSGAYIRELLGYLKGKSVYVNVISKSGTTLEPALAFRFIRDWMEETYEEEDVDDRIIITTDPEKGALNKLREEKGYKKYIIPPDVGGRFSVLTPVGLLPIAVAGIDIHALVKGAAAAFQAYSAFSETNPALQYAATRYLLAQKGYSIEVLATLEEKLNSIGGWWQQLFGESEGKEHKGLFPVSLRYSTDLHSVGQYVQEGQRSLIETFLMAEDDGGNLTVRPSEQNLDGLNYLAGKTYTEVNRKAYEGTAKAHTDGGVPTMTIWMEAITPDAIGRLFYFFEHAVGVSGYLLGVNPFDQPGVEAYKLEMFSRLGKPA